MPEISSGLAGSVTTVNLISPFGNAERMYLGQFPYDPVTATGTQPAIGTIYYDYKVTITQVGGYTVLTDRKGMSSLTDTFTVGNLVIALNLTSILPYRAGYYDMHPVNHDVGATGTFSVTLLADQNEDSPQITIGSSIQFVVNVAVDNSPPSFQSPNNFAGYYASSAGVPMDVCAVSINPTTANICLGDPVYFSWGSHLVDNLNITNIGNQLASSGAMTLHPQVSTTYTVSGTHATPRSRSCVVTVQQPPTLTFSATPAMISDAAPNVLVTWSSTNAAAVDITGIGTGLAPSGSVVMAPGAPISFFAKAYTPNSVCDGEGKVATATATIGYQWFDASAAVAAALSSNPVSTPTGPVRTPGTYPMTYSLAIIIPFLDCDDVTGRIYCAMGSATFDKVYYQTIATDGSASLYMGTYANHKSYPIYLATSEAGNLNCPLTAGRDIGVVPQNGEVLLPDALVILPQEGTVRVGFRRYDPTQSSSLTPGPAYRESADLGLSWSDSAVMITAGTYISTPPRTRALLTGSSRLRRAAARPDATEPSNGFWSQGGATGMLETFQANVSFQRLPTWVDRYTGAQAPAPFYGTGPVRTNPGGMFNGAFLTYDNGASFPAYLYYQLYNIAVTPHGGTITANKDAPGYPCAGDWVEYFPFSGPLFGSPADQNGTLASLWMGRHLPVLSPAGGYVWAKGALTGAGGWVFFPAIARPAMLRPTYIPTLANAVTEGFMQTSDDETGTSGKDWGTQTCITYANTTDGGRSFGTLYALRTSAGIVLADADSVRIAACTGRSNEVYLCVCSRGVATLYCTPSPTELFTAIGVSVDGGKYWTSLPA